MRKQIIAFILFFSSISIASAQHLPTYKEVVRTFFSNYIVNKDDSYVLFQKKKDGWYIVENLYGTPDAYSNLQLFWSTKDHDYKQLNYPVAKFDSNVVNRTVNDYLQNIGDWYEQYSFERNLYYGYPGWDWDVINSVPIDKANQDTLLESLGRAYSNYASGFLIEQYGNHFTNNDTDREILPDTVTISSSRIKEFIKFEKKCWEAYAKLEKLNPQYQTSLGEVAAKLASEHLFMYSDLEMAGDSVDAKKALKDVHYPSDILDAAKMLLTSADKNGILFTKGDNYTYPLWYLQETSGYRKDVIVINTDLLGLRRYIEMLDKNYKGQLFATRSVNYLKKNFDYYLHADFPMTVPVEAGDFVNKLDHYTYADTAINSDPYVIYQGEKIKRYYTTKLFFLKPGTKSITKNMDNMIAISNSTLMMNQFMIIDIINTNLGKRPISFTYQEPLLSNLLKEDAYGYMLDLK